MPLLNTLGSLVEFKQGYTAPNAVSNITISRGLGYDINVNYTIGNIVPPGLQETYTAITIPGNYSNSSTGNTILIKKIDPLDTYSITVYANSVGGSNSTSYFNYYMSSNLQANGNVTIANLVTIDIAPNSNQICGITDTGRLLTYSRNANTGLLTLLANTLIANEVLLDTKYSSDGNFIYILSRTNNANVSTNEVYAYNTANSNVKTVVNAGSAGYSKKLNGIYQPARLIVSPDNKSLIFTAYNNNNANASLISIYNYTRNATSGNLTLFQSNFTPLTSNSFTSNSTITNIIPSFDNKNIYLSIGDAFSVSMADISVLSRNTSNTNLSNLSAYNLSNGNTATISNIVCSFDNISFYASQNQYLTIKTYTRSNTGNLTLTETKTTSNTAPDSIINPANTILITNSNNATYKRDTSTGTLTFQSNTTTFVGTPTFVSDDNYNVYSVSGSNIRIYNITA